MGCGVFITKKLAFIITWKVGHWFCVSNFIDSGVIRRYGIWFTAPSFANLINLNCNTRWMRLYQSVSKYINVFCLNMTKSGKFLIRSDTDETDDIW